MRVAGFGFRKGAEVASLDAALIAAGGDVQAFATAEEKSNATCLQELAARHGVTIIPVAKDALPGVPTATQSNKSHARFGTGSLSEAAALIAAGPGARLIGTRVISPDSMATCAIAERIDP
ncbi:MAG: cobalamin biosynthesis protein [Silicimonas sp.]|nr:cobalamin biosynthesis protein [Silicimonas sp.]